MTSLQRPLLAAHTDDKVDAKVDPVSPDQLPPSYQAAASSEAPPADCPRRRRCRRFGHFLIALFFLWLGARYLVRHCQLRRVDHPHPYADVDADADDDASPWGFFPPGPPPPGRGGHHHRPGPSEQIDTCLDSADWVEIEPDDEYFPRGFEAWQRTELSLPSSADDIFLFSHGPHTGGYLFVVEDPGRDDIGVEVIVGSGKDSELFKKTNLCKLSRGKDGHGVGILSHPFGHRFRDQDSLYFNITVKLPTGKDVTTIPHFETRMPKYTHVITVLDKHEFGFISLHSFDSPIYVWSLAGDKIDVRTRNGPIYGTFNTSSALEVKTSNSPIRVTVNALNVDDHVPTQVKLRTSNSYLYAELALLTTPSSQSAGSFFVCAHTSNSPLGVNFTEHAPDAQLKVQAHTSNSPVGVRLQPAFEGTFNLRTSIFPAVVYPDPDEDVEDPAGRGRKRVVNVKNLGHGSRILYGDAEWVPQGDEVPAGSAEVSTSNSYASISFN